MLYVVSWHNSRIMIQDNSASLNSVYRQEGFFVNNFCYYSAILPQSHIDTEVSMGNYWIEDLNVTMGKITGCGIAVHRNSESEPLESIYENALSSRK